MFFFQPWYSDFLFLHLPFAKGVNTSQQLALKWEGLVSVPGSHSVHCRNTVTLSDAQGVCQSCSLSGLVLLLPAEAPLPCPRCCCFPLLCAVAFPCVQHSPSLSPPSTFPGLMLTPALPGSLDCWWRRSFKDSMSLRSALPSSRSQLIWTGYGAIIAQKKGC